MRTFIVADIQWDKEVDGEIQEVDLPSSMEVEAEDEDSAVDIASNVTGYCIFHTNVMCK